MTTDRPCEGFRAYLSQRDSRICGTYGGVDQRANRLDEGEPRSIIGTVVDSTAVLAITSGRSRGIYLVTAKLDRDSLDWNVVNQNMGPTKTGVRVDFLTSRGGGFDSMLRLMGEKGTLTVFRLCFAWNPWDAGREA